MIILKYILRRIFFFIITAWAALTLDFLLPRIMPGNPAEIMVSKFQGRLSLEAVHALNIAFGLNTKQSIFFQYIEYLSRTLTGNFGISMTFYPTPVSQVLAQAIPWTLGLAGTSTIIAFILGTMFGINVAWHRDSIFSEFSIPISYFISTMPYFWFAIIIEFLFGYLLGWFPLGGAYSSSSVGFSVIISILYHSILPAATIIVTAMGGWMITMRNNMISVLSDDYITFAFAQGIPEKVIKNLYVARNAILPSFTGFAMAIGFIIGGVLLTEMIFSYPGVGYILYQAILNIDYPLMQAIFLFITMTVLVANFIADVLYVLIDPRIRLS